MAVCLLFWGRGLSRPPAQLQGREAVPAPTPSQGQELMLPSSPPRAARPLCLAPTRASPQGVTLLGCPASPPWARKVEMAGPRLGVGSMPLAPMASCSYASSPSGLPRVPHTSDVHSSPFSHTPVTQPQSPVRPAGWEQELGLGGWTGEGRVCMASCLLPWVGRMPPGPSQNGMGEDPTDAWVLSTGQAGARGSMLPTSHHALSPAQPRLCQGDGGQAPATRGTGGCTSGGGS